MEKLKTKQSNWQKVKLAEVLKGKQEKLKTTKNEWMEIKTQLQKVQAQKEQAKANANKSAQVVNKSMVVDGR